MNLNRSFARELRDFSQTSHSGNMVIVTRGDMDDRGVVVTARAVTVVNWSQ